MTNDSNQTIPRTMLAVVTTGNGGYDKLEFKRVPVPQPGSDEVLIKVLSAGVNNTEINTRLGWYSSTMTGSTADTSQQQEGRGSAKADGGWNAATPFPLIQGTDCCGRVVESGSSDHQGLIGKRVLVRACMRVDGFDSLECRWMASDFDGAFAQFVKVPAAEVFAVDCDWSDAELATIPCAYATAENMLHRADVREGERVLVIGASGGVGSAAVQLARRRGAIVSAVAGRKKLAAIRDIGARQLIPRGENIVAALGEQPVDVVVDNVAGEQFPQLLKVLKRGGRYVSSGAIAGPIVELDLRDLYLKDIRLIGSTAWDEPVFPNLIRYIENGEIQPLLAGTFALEQIVDAQREFLRKQHVGNFVLIPPHEDQEPTSEVDTLNI